MAIGLLIVADVTWAGQTQVAMAAHKVTSLMHAWIDVYTDSVTASVPCKQETKA